MGGGGLRYNAANVLTLKDNAAPIYLARFKTGGKIEDRVWQRPIKTLHISLNFEKRRLLLKSYVSQNIPLFD